MVTMNPLPEGLARLREPHQPERLEAYAATLAQEGRSGNEDAFLIRGAPAPLLALADGAGAAEQAARRALRELERLVAAATIEEIASFRSWSGWFHAIDAVLAGGGETTLIALVQLDGRLLGAGCGDSRAYLWDAEGRLRLLTEGCCKRRLGSGEVTPCAIHTPFGRGELLLLASDGAWTPLPHERLRQTIAGAALRPLAELPEVVLRAASRTGRADDMTVLAARRR
jgi:serine/threonine protein phosphatase PrpC